MRMRNKSKISTIALVLVLAMAALMASISYVAAQEYPTRCFLAVQPNPVGVGQHVTISVIVQPVPPTVADVYHDVELTITKPDGTVETYVRDTYTHGGYYIIYTPAMTGTYKLQMDYPGEYFRSRDETRSSSVSPVIELIVQDEPIPGWPETPVPTDYWTRPISADLREWAPISGNWLQMGYNTTYRMGRNPSAYNPYSTAPRSPHIMWTQELGLGGHVGGEHGSTSYYGGLVYELFLMPPIVMNGRIYYNLYFDSSPFEAFACVDLRTGEELWRVEDANVDVGQLWDFRSPNQYGVIPLLWETGSTYRMYDPFSGKLIASFEDASTGRIVHDDDGTMLVYILNGQRNWLAMWNSTKAFEENGFIGYFPAGTGFFRLQTGTFDWRRGIEWNVTVPNVNMTIGNSVYYPSAFSISGDVILASGGPGFSDQRLHAGYSAKNGSLLWAFEREPKTMPHIRTAVGDGAFAVHNTVSTRFHGYDIATGEPLWVSDELVYPWGAYIGLSMLIADRKLIAGSYDGYMHAFDIDTGKEVWKYYSGDSGYETPYDSWPFFYSFMVADGVLFAPNGEHSASQPLYRGAKLHAIDMEKGEGIWNMTGWYVNYAIVDGYLLTHNAYTNQMYCIGKGPSATTVSVSDGVIANGDSVLIEGTVTDQSPSQKDTPAVSKESMSAWMEHLHMQKPIPANVNGVPVTLRAMSSNGTVIDIGTTTTNGFYGAFSYEWTPPDEDLYTIIAHFAGDDSYGSSSAATGLSVGPEPPEPIEPAVQEDITALTPILYGTIAAVVVAIVIGIVNLYALRKRK